MRKKNLEDEEELEEREERLKKLKQIDKMMELTKMKLDLDRLKLLIEQGIISKNIAEKISEGGILDSQQVIEIFAKIDQIERIRNIDEILPVEYRITKEEYVIAKVDEEKRKELLLRLEKALDLLSQKLVSYDMFGLSIFTSLYSLFDNDLRCVQDNTIDIMDSLSDNGSLGG